jgi:hypothetical protein
MTDRDDNVLDKAETMARRVLERLGAKLDRKLHPEDKALSHQTVGSLAIRVEQAVESNLEPDKSGFKRIAPNCFEVLLTYEEASEVTDQYLDALAGELKVTTQEYVNNRRYDMTAPIQLKVRRDLFTKATTVNASFDPTPNTTARGGATGTPQAVATQGQGGRTINLTIVGGGAHRLILRQNEAPKSIGRVAGNAVRIDDESVSRLHCSLALRSAGEIVVSDLGSANGTSINGRLLRKSEACAVATGDVITVGDIKLTITGIE